MTLAQHAASFPNAMRAQPYAPTLDYAPPPLLGQRARDARFLDRYFTFLACVLLGYALGGRGFAYWGINPLFVGEITLLVGLVVLLKSKQISRLLSLDAFLPLLLFMTWGGICTLPHLSRYGKDAIRDAVVWGYGTYAFIVAALLISDPTRVMRMVLYFRKFTIWFLVLAPITYVLTVFFEEQLPLFPGGANPIIQVKGGDMCVHLAGVMVYSVALGAGIHPIIPSFFIPLNFALNLQGRAGMVAFAVAASVSMTLRPFHPRLMRIFFVLGLCLFVLWASDLRIERGPREISFRYLVTAVGSIVGESSHDDLNDTKEWRVRWWSKIINYTFHGDYFWMGKGFGINLASEDGFQTQEDEALRSPHNGHMTMLARAGVPGFLLWVMAQGTFAYLMVITYFKARKLRRKNWSGVFMFLGAYWAAFMANATFDVFLEGPMGGIWMWCIYGAGIACVHVFKRYPDLLTPGEPQPAFATAR
jgi:hypothetical protein